MRSIEEVMEILEAYDLTQSFEAAARLASCDAKTVGPLRSYATKGCAPTLPRRVTRSPTPSSIRSRSGSRAPGTAYRVIIPTRDTTLATVVANIDSTLREFQGVPTYALTDNERTMSTGHLCGIVIRPLDILAVVAPPPALK